MIIGHQKILDMIAILTDGTQEPWHQWFAWYPVKRNLWLTVSGDESSSMNGVHVHRWIWLKKIYRRRVYKPGSDGGWRWEYDDRDIFERMLDYANESSPNKDD